MTMAGSTSAPAEAMLPLESDLARLIVTALSLEVAPETIAPEAPLFGEGLGLDSVDALELVMSLEHTFGIRVEDKEAGRRTLSSVASIAAWLRGKGVDTV